MGVGKGAAAGGGSGGGMSGGPSEESAEKDSTSVGDFFARARASAFFFADAIFFFADANARAHGFETQNKKCAGAAWNANYFCARALRTY